MIKAVILDLFETLMTEWGHEKYRKDLIAADLHLPYEDFSRYEVSLHEELYSGRVSYEEMLINAIYMYKGYGDLDAVMAKRVETKNACFDYILPETYEALETLRSRSIKTGIVTNCSADEVLALKGSRLESLMDAVILSCEEGRAKPDREIYLACSVKLGIAPEDCLFIGDSDYELYGAEEAGMKPAQALWFREKYLPDTVKPNKFPKLHAPGEILTLIEAL